MKAFFYEGSTYSEPNITLEITTGEEAKEVLALYMRIAKESAIEGDVDKTLEYATTAKELETAIKKMEEYQNGIKED